MCLSDYETNINENDEMNFLTSKEYFILCIQSMKIFQRLINKSKNSYNISSNSFK